MSHNQFLVLLGLLMDASATLAVYRYTYLAPDGKNKLRDGLGGSALFTVVTNSLLAMAGWFLIGWAFYGWVS